MTAPPALGLFSLARLLDRSTRLNREPQTAWRIINADGSGATKASSIISTTRLRKQTMKHTEAASETHQQEHRIEFHRTRPSKERRVAERCAWARVRFAAPMRALAHCAPFCTESRWRRAAPAGTQFTRVIELLEGAAFSPLWFRTLWLTSAAFSWKRRCKNPHSAV